MVTAADGHKTPCPDLQYGQRFKVCSRRGTPYVATFLHRGDGESGVYVRLDDRRIARLDDTRVSWSTYAHVSGPGEPIVGPGDDVLVETATGGVRGTLLERVGHEIAVRTVAGRDVRVPRLSVLAFFLLFRAQDLRPGDRFIVRSKSGNEYQGTVTGVGPGDRATVQLKSGDEVSLRLERIDMNSLYVPIPIQLEA